MRTKVRAVISITVTICLAAAVLIGSLPAALAATTVKPDPIVQSEKLSVPKGNPFEATFDFIHDNYSDYHLVDKIIISVSSPNGAISLAKRSFSTQYNEIEENPLIANETHAFSYRLTVPEKYLTRVGEGSGTLKFAVSYYDFTGKWLDSFTVQKTIFDSTGTSPSSTAEGGLLSVSSYSVDHSPIKEGEKFRLALTVKNNGGAACSNIMSALDVSAAEGISIDGVTDTQYISSIGAGSTAVITYPMTCLAKMATNNYALGVTLSADEMSKAATSKIYIPVAGTKTDKDTGTTVGASKPQIIIESYDYGGASVTGGKEFLLTMNIKNTGTAPIENIKMTVSSTAEGTAETDTGGAFTPSKSSNTFFISKLGGGAVVQKQIALLPKSDAAPKSYGVGVGFKYEAVLDSKRESLEAQETIAIPLTQPDRFEANDAALPGPMYLGSPGQLSINYVNKGKSKVFNLSVKLAGNFTTAEMNSYIGNLDSGAGDTFQATLNPTAEGKMTGTAVFSYEDANGVTKSLTKEFTCEVMAVPNGGEGVSSEPAPLPDAGKSSVPWQIPAAGGAVILAAIVVFVIIHKKRKAKKLRLLEESDDYDDQPAGGEKPE